MARIPDPSSMSRPGVSTPGRIATINPGGASGLQDIGRVVSGVAQNELNRRSNMELAVAKSNFYRKSLEVEREIQEDPSAYGSWQETYTSRMQEAIEEFSASISDPTLKEQFQLQAGDKRAAGADRMYSAARSREIDEGRASLDSLIDQNIDMALEAGNEGARQDLLAGVNEGINGALEAGYISAEQAGEMRRRSAENYARRRASMLAPAERLAAVGALPPQIANVIAGAGGSAEETATLQRIAILESAGDPNARNKSGAEGLFQFKPETAADHGLENAYDPERSSRAALALLRGNAAVLRNKLGRKPTGAELYLAHQQGAGGATALLRDPGRGAVDVLAEVYGSRQKARLAVIQNGGDVGMTAGEFAGMWRRKFDGSGSSNLAKFLPMDDRIALARGAMREIESLSAARERDYTQGFQDYIGAVKAGGNVAPEIAAAYSDEQIAANVVDPAQQARMQAARDDSLMQAWAMQGIQGSTPDQMAAILASVDSLADAEITDAIGLEMAPDRQRMRQAVSKAIEADMKARLDDPARYAAETSPVVAQAQGQGAQAYANATLAEQARMGVPDSFQRVTGKQQAAGMVAQIMEQPADTRGAALAGQADEWGRHWPKVLNEMKAAGLDTATYYSAMVADDPLLSERVAALATTPVSELKKGIETTEVTDLQLSVMDEMQDFRAVFEAGDPTGAAARTINELTDVAFGVALQEYRATGDARGAVDYAISGLVNDRYEILDGGNFQAYVPNGHDVGQIEDTAEAMMRPEALAAIVPLGGDEGQPGFIREDRIARAARRGTWVTNATGDGLVLMLDVDGRYVPAMTERGPYGFGFDETPPQAAPAEAVAPSNLSGRNAPREIPATPEPPEDAPIEPPVSSSGRRGRNRSR